MANDNQTALGMSIQRKKDEVKRIEHKIYLAKWDNSFHPTREEYAKLSVLPGEITEDEKLLAVDREQKKKYFVDGYSEGRSFPFHLLSSITRSNLKNYQLAAERRFNEKYGTDGK